MIRVASENDLRATFRALDREQVRVAPGLRFPLAIKDYLAWPEPSGARVYLVYVDTILRQPVGVVFQRTHAGADAPAGMCNWCHTVRTGSGVSLLTTRVSPLRTVGLPLCSDLSCKDNVRGSPGVNDFPESLSRDERVMRVMQRMTEFVHKNLL